MKLKNIYSSSQWRNQPSRTGGKEGGDAGVGAQEKPHFKNQGGELPSPAPLNDVSDPIVSN